MKDKNRLESLDSLRGIAAISVLLKHYGRDFYGNSNNPFEYGHLGVFLFFIISGFVIFLTADGKSKVNEFLVSRFSRLYPSYWLNVLITFLLINLTNVFNYKFNFYQLLGNLTMLQHWLLIRHIDGVYWTLTIELCFYFLILCAIWTKSLAKYKLYSWLFLVLMLISHYLLKIIHLPIYYVMPILHYGHYFIAGMVFYEMKKGDIRYNHHALLITTYAVQLLIDENPWDEDLIILSFYLIFYLFIYEKTSFLNLRPLIFLGSISYSLYLFHELNGIIIFNYLPNSIPLIFKFIFVSIISIVCASLRTYYIEKPSLKFIRAYKNLNKK